MCIYKEPVELLRLRLQVKSFSVRKVMRIKKRDSRDFSILVDHSILFNVGYSYQVYKKF